MSVYEVVFVQLSCCSAVFCTHRLVQVSEVYQTIEFAHLAKLAPFADNFRLERIIVDAAKSLDLPVI